MAVPGKEDGRDVLPRFKLDIRLLVICMQGALHQNGPPPLLELTLDQLQLLGHPWALFQRLVPPSARVGFQRSIGLPLPEIDVAPLLPMQEEIGRASCRERV